VRKRGLHDGPARRRWTPGSLPRFAGFFRLAADLTATVRSDGLYYVGDKLGLIGGAAPCLTEDGLFLASLDLCNLRVGGSSARRLKPDLLRAGLRYDARRPLVSCRERKRVDLPYGDLGADDTAGPNSTGRPAVGSHHEFIGNATP
jgi:hypothetical protein